MQIKFAPLMLIALLISGCAADYVLYMPPEEQEITVHPSWNYDSHSYHFNYSVNEDYYKDVQNTPRPKVKNDFGELVDLAYGSGLSKAEEIADDLYDESPYHNSSCREIEYVVAYIQSLSYGSSFYYNKPLNYPLEVAVDGGTSSADLTALAAVALDHLNYNVGIAVFYNPCCDDEIHVALGVANYYPFSHGTDNLGTKWVFFETVGQYAGEDVHDRPEWMDYYDHWLVWPLWEQDDHTIQPRKVTQQAKSHNEIS
jgi:hypothetical protein